MTSEALELVLLIIRFISECVIVNVWEVIFFIAYPVFWVVRYFKFTCENPHS